MKDFQKATRMISEFNDPKALERFEKDAAAYAKKATSSPVKARNTLVRLGMSTKSGNITAKYKK